MNKVAEALYADIEKATEPSKMSKAEALEVYEALIDNLKGACEALRDELAEDE